ncbi:MAG: ATP-binding cassette domain-containing protein [Spirochaetota bacterium]
MSIKTYGLSKKYGDLTAVQHLDLEVQKGEIFGFLGVNGAGKTTTVHMLATMIKPSAGRAEVCGYDLLKSPGKVRESIGIVMQNTSMEGDLTAEETLLIYGRLYGVNDKSKATRLLALDVRFGSAVPGSVRFRSGRPVCTVCRIPAGQVQFTDTGRLFYRSTQYYGWVHSSLFRAIRRKDSVPIVSRTHSINGRLDGKPAALP